MKEEKGIDACDAVAFFFILVGAFFIAIEASGMSKASPNVGYGIGSFVAAIGFGAIIWHNKKFLLKLFK